MTNFYISEILALDQEIVLMTDLEKKLEQIQVLVKKHLENKQAKNLIQKKLDWRWYNSQLESFKIDLARDIINESQFANLQNEQTRVLVLLNFETAGNPAQNALLKLIEEPPNETLIILPVSQTRKILPTINSRCRLINLEKKEKKELDNYSWPTDMKTAIELVKSHKKRDQAQLLVWNLLQQKLEVKAKQALNQAYFDLNHNFNVELCLEHCFFSVLAPKK